jgi:capsular exopolysaccharide synthesis family protein
LQKLREQEAIAARVAAQMEQTSGANYPPLASARAGLADLQGRIAAEMGRLKASAARDVTIAAAHVRMLEQTMNASNQELDATSKDELTAVQLDRDIEVDRHLYDDLLLRSKQASIQDQLETPDTRIASAPTLPLVPAFPRKGMLMAVATMAAGLIGIAAAFLVESLGGRKAFALETIASRCGVAGLAIIPKLGKKEMGLVGRPEATSHLGVALHRLRNSIAFRCGSQTPKVTVFASALPGDGKTLLSTLYARSLASSGTRVLLIDADLRHRGLTKSTAAQANLGLTEHLGGKTLEECVVRDVVEGVDVLPAGSAGDDPSVLFNAGRVELLLAEAAKTYTAIIVDTAPVGVVDDALHFIARADATVMVARWNSTPLAFISRAVERIGLAGGKLVGLALTAVDMRKYRSQSETPSDFVRYQSYYLTNG